MANKKKKTTYVKATKGAGAASRLTDAWATKRGLTISTQITGSPGNRQGAALYSRPGELKAKELPYSSNTVARDGATITKGKKKTRVTLAKKKPSTKAK